MPWDNRLDFNETMQKNEPLEGYNEWSRLKN